MSDLSRGVLIRLTHSVTGDTYYFCWSGSCDAPATSRMTETDLLAALLEDAAGTWPVSPTEGPEAKAERLSRAAFESRMALSRYDRVVSRGTSVCDSTRTGEEFASFNRAGTNEEQITTDEIIERYV